MPALTANAEERVGVLLRWVDVVKGPCDGVFLTLIHGPGIAGQILVMGTRLLSLLFQLLHQFFPFRGEGGMLPPQILQQQSHTLRFFRALVYPQ